MHLCYQKKLEDFLPKIYTNKTQRKLFDNLIREEVSYQIDDSQGFVIPNIETKRINDRLLNVYFDDDKFLGIDREKIKRTDINVGDLIEKVRAKNLAPSSIGIDLSGSEKRQTGFCILREDEAYLDAVKTDEEIIAKTLGEKPTVISIDSPLSLPKGRCCVDDSCVCRKYGITRECERILKKRGINVYPCLISSMQKLTLRGMRLAKVFEGQGFEVIESYPGAAQDILGIPRKRVDLKELETDLRNMGIEITSERETITHDELDALTSALVGYFYLAGDYEAIGNIDERYLIIPKFTSKEKTNGSWWGEA